MDTSPYVSILQDVFNVQDVSTLPQERARVLSVPELAGDFQKLGFQSVGFYRMGRGDGYVYEVWRSPDSRAFLTLEHDERKRPRAEIRTLLQDGTIVDTSSRHSGLARLYRRSRVHHPESGYLMKTFSGPPELLWRKHSERLDAILRERKTSLPPHDSMRTQLALTARSMVVSFVRRLKSRRLEWTVLIPATVAIIGPVIFTGAPLYWLAAAALAGVGLWYAGEYSTWLAARLIRIPPVLPAALMAAVDATDRNGPWRPPEAS